MEFRFDGPTAPLVGSVTILITGGWQTWQTVTASASGATGPHNLYLVFNGGSAIGNLNWFRLSSPPQQASSRRQSHYGLKSITVGVRE